MIKNIVWRPRLPLGMHIPCTNYNNLILKKEQTILLPAKYNHKCEKEINLLPPS